jgi:hypothetical protein
VDCRDYPTDRQTTGAFKMRRASFFAGILAVLCAFDASGADPEQLLALMQGTKFVWISDYKGKASEFKEDTDPLTVEIVVLEKPSQGRSHVSEDGQVIFLRVGDDARSEALIEESTEKRLKLLTPKH